MLDRLKSSKHVDPNTKKQLLDDSLLIQKVSIPKYRVKGSFVEYVIECSRLNATWQVFRRYQQFKNLHTQLASMCTLGSSHHEFYGALPTLCPSSWTEVTNQSPELVERRRKHLEIYLEQLLVTHNLWYAAKTPLYNFFHDNEVQVYHRSRANRPLPGLGIPAVAEEDDDNLLHSNQIVAVQTAALQSPESAIAGSVPDMTSTTSLSKTVGGPHDSHDLGREHSVGKVEEADLPDAHDLLPREKCGVCGHEQTVDYDLEEWQSEGRCEGCCQFTTHTLIRPAAPQLLVPGGGEAAGGGASKNQRHQAMTVVADDYEGEDRPNCSACSQPFSLTVNRKCCMRCQNVFCTSCSEFVLRPVGDTLMCRRCREESLSQHHTPDTKPLDMGAEGFGHHSAAHIGTPVESAMERVFQPSSCEVTCEMPGNPLYATVPEAGAPPPPQPKPKEKLVVRTDVSLKDFELITTLGRGTFGKVMKVRFLPTGEIYAMKVLSKHVVHKRRMVDYIKEEKKIMCLIEPHPFVVRLHFAFQTDQHLYFGLEFLPGGELYSHIYPQGRLKEHDARLYIAELVLAVEHIHSFDVVHRDIKPENIVLNAAGHIKLTDFGLARSNFSKSRRRSFVGSAEYLAPETISGDAQTRALDWWSVGVMLYEMLAGVAPFTAPTNNEVYQFVLHKRLDYGQPFFSPSAVNLLQKLLEKDYKHRLADPEKIKAHPFFYGIDWDAVYHMRVTPPFVPDLQHNDTKYFNRDFTAEWAVITRTPGTSRQSMEQLTKRFSNFAMAEDEATSIAMMAKTGTAQGTPAVRPHTPAPDECEFINPEEFVGSWRLIKVEMVSSDGKVSFPWGSEVAGSLVYHENGLFAMQLSPMKRIKFKHGGSKVTRDEIADAYVGYVAMFGNYEVVPGKSYLVHKAKGSLCPNSIGQYKKHYFEFTADHILLLSTGISDVGEGVKARTNMVWERVPGKSPALPPPMVVPAKDAPSGRQTPKLGVSPNVSTQGHSLPVPPGRNRGSPMVTSKSPPPLHNSPPPSPNSKHPPLPPAYPAASKLAPLPDRVPSTEPSPTQKKTEGAAPAVTSPNKPAEQPKPTEPATFMS